MLSCLLCPGKHALQMRMKYLRRSQQLWACEKSIGIWIFWASAVGVDGLQAYSNEVRGPTFDKQYGSCMVAAWQREPSLTSKDSFETLWSSTFWGRFCIVAQRLPLFHPTGSYGIEAVKIFSPTILLSWACPQGLFHMHSNKWNTISYSIARYSQYSLKKWTARFLFGSLRQVMPEQQVVVVSFLARVADRRSAARRVKELGKILATASPSWQHLLMNAVPRRHGNSFPSFFSLWSLWALKLHLCFCMLWIWCFSWNILKPWMEACLADLQGTFGRSGWAVERGSEGCGMLSCWKTVLLCFASDCHCHVFWCGFSFLKYTSTWAIVYYVYMSWYFLNFVAPKSWAFVPFIFVWILQDLRNCSRQNAASISTKLTLDSWRIDSRPVGGFRSCRADKIFEQSIMIYFDFMIEVCLTMIYYAYHGILILHAEHFPLDLRIWFARYGYAGFGHRRPSLLLRLISISGLKPSKLNPKWSRSFRVWKLLYIYIYIYIDTHTYYTQVTSKASNGPPLLVCWFFLPTSFNFVGGGIAF